MPQSRPAPPGSGAFTLQFVILHKPGPAWRHGAPIIRQPGSREHADYYQMLYEKGKVVFGGPFLDAGAGGMMVLAAGIHEAEARSIAAADPAIAVGLLRYEVRTWMPTLAPRRV